MDSEEQFLPPAAVEGWFRLACAVVRVTADHREREKWEQWGQMRQVLREMNQAPTRSEGSTGKARRMGNFEGGDIPSKHMKWGGI